MKLCKFDTFMTVLHNSHPKKLLDRSSPWRNTEASVACILVMLMAIGGSSIPEHAATCSTRAPTSGKLDEKARYVAQFVRNHSVAPCKGDT